MLFASIDVMCTLRKDEAPVMHAIQKQADGQISWCKVEVGRSWIFAYIFRVGPSTTVLKDEIFRKSKENSMNTMEGGDFVSQQLLAIASDVTSYLESRLWRFIIALSSIVDM